MARHRLSQHAMDAIFKLEAQQLGAALGRRFGINLPPIVRHFPTELPVVDVHLEQLDSVFELADEDLLHLEFQTVHRRETLPRFLLYDAYLIERFGRRVHTVVFYGAQVDVTPDPIDGGSVQYSVYNVLLGQEDGEATYQRLQQQLERSSGLSAEDRLDLIFLPLMRHVRERREVVTETVALAQQLPERQQRQAVAALIGLGHQYLDEEELNILVEGLMSTTLGQRLLERGREEGQREGLERAILHVLTTRVGPVPPAMRTRLAEVEDLQRLEVLLDRAMNAQSLEEFAQALR
ncbi:MAG TPA: hypothetical protein VFE42_33865 [Chloroflexota bacterium]|nr:hypothetical protein [Chloroflexota bacterium]